MVETDTALESEYITKELIKESVNKIGVIIDGGDYEDVEFDGKTSRRLTLGVDFNKSLKKYRPNRDSVKNLRDMGKDTNSWVGRKIFFSVMLVGGQERIMASPMPDEVKNESQ
jgi:hypothetical protein